MELIREKCLSEWGWSSLKDVFLIRLSEIDGDFLQPHRKVKKEITGCMTENFLVREEAVLFEARSGAWNCSFKSGKTLTP